MLKLKYFMDGGSFLTFDKVFDIYWTTRIDQDVYLIDNFFGAVLFFGCKILSQTVGFKKKKRMSTSSFIVAVELIMELIYDIPGVEEVVYKWVTSLTPGRKIKRARKLAAIVSMISNGSKEKVSTICNGLHNFYERKSVTVDQTLTEINKVLHKATADLPLREIRQWTAIEKVPKWCELSSIWSNHGDGNWMSFKRVEVKAPFFFNCDKLLDLYVVDRRCRESNKRVLNLLKMNHYAKSINKLVSKSLGACGVRKGSTGYRIDVNLIHYTLLCMEVVWFIIKKCTTKERYSSFFNVMANIETFVVKSEGMGSEMVDFIRVVGIDCSRSQYVEELMLKLFWVTVAT